MPEDNTHSFAIAEILERDQGRILAGWLDHMKEGSARQRSLLSGEELQEQASTFLGLLRAAVSSSGLTVGSGSRWQAVKDFLGDISRSRNLQGFTPSETASFVFSLKQALFQVIQERNSGDAGALVAVIWSMSKLLDELGLYTTEVFIQTREELIRNQQQDLLELSTPVVSLWDGILALPVIGTLDSERTQAVMESLLQRIVDTNSDVAIIDITGVPAVDTLVAQHLIKTVTAARLMGADCIISGIRPQIAQTIVHLGVDLGDIVTKSTLSSAFARALMLRRLKIVAS